MADPNADTRPERILDLTARLHAVAGVKIGEITTVNRQAKMLSMNAMVVAARAGDAGKSFAVVADEFKKLSTQIDVVAAALESQVRADLEELTQIGGAIISQMRGQRLIDLALNAIDIIDRNLYERTCDVRWWATDAAVVACAADRTPETAQHAGRRLRVILEAYTVYLDLWICDAAGQVLATGRPERYPGTKALSVAREPWFVGAMRLPSGDHFVADDIKSLRALNDAPVATFATAIRENGASTGKPIGVLGIHFDWKPQAQAVVNGVRLTAEERQRCRVLILDRAYRVLAASDGKGLLEETIPLRVDPGGTGSYADGEKVIGYAVTPGYETYKGMGWFGCLIQSKDAPAR